MKIFMIIASYNISLFWLIKGWWGVGRTRKSYNIWTLISFSIFARMSRNFEVQSHPEFWVWFRSKKLKRPRPSKIRHIFFHKTYTLHHLEHHLFKKISLFHNGVYIRSMGWAKNWSLNFPLNKKMRFVLCLQYTRARRKTVKKMFRCRKTSPWWTAAAGNEVKLLDPAAELLDFAFVFGGVNCCGVFATFLTVFSQLCCRHVEMLLPRVCVIFWII